MGEGQLAIPDWELFESEARSRLLDLDDYGDVLPADVAIRIKTAARSVVSAYWDAPDQIQDRLAALRACVGSLLEVVEAARRERDESLAAARQANPNSVLVGRGTDMQVAPTATATLHSLQKAGRWPSAVQARPAMIRPQATSAPRRGPSRAVRGTRRTQTRTTASKSEPEPSDPPPWAAAPRRSGEQHSRTDSPLNQCWQLGLVMNVEELRTLAVLAETRATWLGRWDTAA